MGIIDYDETEKKFYYYINTMDNKEINWSKSFKSYDEAEVECLKRLIIIVKNPE